MSDHKIFNMAFAKVYPAYINKAERKGRSKDEVDEIIRWLTGYSQKQLDKLVSDEKTIRSFLEEAPAFNPNAELIKGVVCGIRVEEIDDREMQQIRYLDKLIDELAKGKAMEKILRS